MPAPEIEERLRQLTNVFAARVTKEWIPTEQELRNMLRTARGSTRILLTVFSNISRLISKGNEHNIKHSRRDIIYLVENITKRELKKAADSGHPLKEYRPMGATQ